MITTGFPFECLKELNFRSNDLLLHLSCDNVILWEDFVISPGRQNAKKEMVNMAEYKDS